MVFCNYKFRNKEHAVRIQPSNADFLWRISIFRPHERRWRMLSLREGLLLIPHAAGNPLIGERVIGGVVLLDEHDAFRHKDGGPN